MRPLVSAILQQRRYDAVAPRFDRHRSLPRSIPEAIRTAVLDMFAGSLQNPRILDLGAGTGRFGQAFVAAGNDYVGLDLSHGMLAEFLHWAERSGSPRPCLVQADGLALPFRESAFDAVMLMQVVGAVGDWDRLIAEARRVLRPSGVLIVGHTIFPAGGLDELMKDRLAAILRQLSVLPYHLNARAELPRLLAEIAGNGSRVVAATWQAERTPRRFLERQPTGARFSALPEAVKADALEGLSAWALNTFGSLDKTFSERHEFELQIFRFAREAAL